MFILPGIFIHLLTRLLNLLFSVNHLTAMKSLPILFFLVIPLCIFPLSSFAQLELNSDGRVGIGTVPSGSYTLNVRTTTGIENAINIISDTGDSGATRYGIQALARNGTGTNIGIQGRADNGSSENRGVYGYATGGSNAYGVVGNVGSASSNAYAGYFIGSVIATGSITPYFSDQNLKENIVTLEARSIIEKLMQLRPVSFAYRTNEHDRMNMPKGIRYGLIAQEVEQVFPEFVNEVVHPGDIDGEGFVVSDPASYKAVSTLDLIPLLLTAMQDQQAEIDALRSALEANGILVNR